MRVDQKSSTLYGGRIGNFDGDKQMKSHIMHTNFGIGRDIVRDLAGRSADSALNGKTEAVNDKVFARMCLDVSYTVRHCRMNICIRVDYGDILMTVKNGLWV